MANAEPVRVWRNYPNSGPYPGVRIGSVVAYEFMVEPRWTRTGNRELQRSYLLLDEGVDMAQPVGFQLDQRDWWYIDLVYFEIEGSEIRRNDMWIDLIVGPPSQPYNVLDLEEFGGALRNGALDVERAADILQATQAFIALHLDRHCDPRGTQWPDFPPRALEPVRNVAIAPLASI